MNIGTLHGGIDPGQWADDSGIQGVPDSFADPVIGYFVEYEGAAIPEPTTLQLFGIGIAALVGRRTRRRYR